MEGGVSVGKYTRAVGEWDTEGTTRGVELASTVWRVGFTAKAKRLPLRRWNLTLMKTVRALVEKK